MQIQQSSWNDGGTRTPDGNIGLLFLGPVIA